MKLRFSLLLCFFTVALLFSQEAKRINGQIIVSDATTANVLVLNLNSTKETLTDKEGNFSIDVKLGDLLIFQAAHLDKMRKIIDEEAFENPLI